jgi:hypothetical protein
MPLGIPVLITYLLVGYSVGAEPSVVSSPNQSAVGISMLMDWKTPKKNSGLKEVSIGFLIEIFSFNMFQL